MPKDMDDDEVQAFDAARDAWNTERRQRIEPIPATPYEWFRAGWIAGREFGEQSA